MLMPATRELGADVPQAGLSPHSARRSVIGWTVAVKQSLQQSGSQRHVRGVTWYYYMSPCTVYGTYVVSHVSCTTCIMYSQRHLRGTTT